MIRLALSSMFAAGMLAFALPAQATPTPPTPPAPDHGQIHEFPAGTPEGTLREALRCALDIAEEPAAFECYAALNVLDNTNTENSRVHLREYQWKVFRQRASGYVMSTAPFTVEITRRDTSSSSPGKEDVKLFLRSNQRDNPAPILFRREDGHWRIHTSSL